jgi:hypothetical protein
MTATWLRQLGRKRKLRTAMKENFQNRIGRTRLAERGCQDTIAKVGQPGEESKERTAGKGLPRRG